MGAQERAQERAQELPGLAVNPVVAAGERAKLAPFARGVPEDVFALDESATALLSGAPAAHCDRGKFSTTVSFPPVQRHRQPIEAARRRSSIGQRIAQRLWALL